MEAGQRGPAGPRRSLEPTRFDGIRRAFPRQYDVIRVKFAFERKEVFIRRDAVRKHDSTRKQVL